MWTNQQIDKKQFQKVFELLITIIFLILLSVIFLVNWKLFLLRFIYLVQQFIKKYSTDAHHESFSFVSDKEQSDSLKTKQETLESTDTELTETTALLNQRLKQLRNEKVISTDKSNQSSSQTKSTPGDHLNKLGEKIYIEPIKESDTFKPNITEKTTFKSTVYQESKEHDENFQQNSKTDEAKKRKQSNRSKKRQKVLDYA